VRCITAHCRLITNTQRTPLSEAPASGTTIAPSSEYLHSTFRFFGVINHQARFASLTVIAFAKTRASSRRCRIRVTVRLTRTWPLASTLRTLVATTRRALRSSSLHSFLHFLALRGLLCSRRCIKQGSTKILTVKVANVFYNCTAAGTITVQGVYGYISSL